MKYLTYTNVGCQEICENMIESLRAVHGFDDNKFEIHIEALDSDTYNTFGFARPTSWVMRNTYKITETPDLKQYQNWSFDPSSNFAKIVSWKWKLIKKFYDEHGEFIFVDSDIFFRRNPEKILRSYSKPFCIQSDLPGSRYCTGFMYFAGKNPTCDYITKVCANNHMDDQLILNKILNENTKILENVLILDPTLFPNGHVYYKTDIDKKIPYIVHNNHMVGLETKKETFLKHDMWRNTSLWDDKEHSKIRYE